MGKLTYSISGLQEFIITFEEFCVPCPYSKNCKYNKNKPFTVSVECKDLTNALEYLKNKEMEKLAKKNPSMDWDTRSAKAKVTKAAIYSEIWTNKVKARKDEIVCLNSKRVDSMIVSTRSEEWWSDFRELLKKIDEECSKIV
jgi:hypothetical protein